MRGETSPLHEKTYPTEWVPIPPTFPYIVPFGSAIDDGRGGYCSVRRRIVRVIILETRHLWSWNHLLRPRSRGFWI